MSVGRRTACGVALLFVVTGCGDGSDGSEEPDPLVAELCQAVEDAAGADVDAARAQFTDRAHQPLHELAAEVTQVDRTLAARLLEAKEQVEADLDQRNLEPDVLADDLATLAEAASAAQALLDQPGPGPCS